MAVSLHTLVEHCNTLLDHAHCDDWSSAYNGLQIENNGTVSRVALAVDCHIRTIQKSIDMGADLLVVHHGLFWQDQKPLTGIHYQKIKACMTNNLAIYSSHLPLDKHPLVGNNIGLLRAIGLDHLPRTPCGMEKGQFVGFKLKLNQPRDYLLEQLQNHVSLRTQLIPAGPANIGTLGVVSGGAGQALAQLKAEGCDTFITGEGPHWTYGLAYELAMNVFYAGHYDTEVFGVKALGQWIKEQFLVDTFFIDDPSFL